MIKDQLLDIDIKNLKRLKNRLRKDIGLTEDESLKESMLDYISDIDDVIHEKRGNKFNNYVCYDCGIKFKSETHSYYQNKGGCLNCDKVLKSISDTEWGKVDLPEETKYIKENEGGSSGTGVAMATQGNVSGMGNVAASQPSSVPGAAFTGDGTVGSGDIGFPLKVYTKKGATGQKYVKHGKKKGKKSKKKSNLVSNVEDFLRTHKKGKKISPIKFGNVPEKMMDFQEFLKDKSTKVTKINK